MSISRRLVLAIAGTISVAIVSAVTVTASGPIGTQAGSYVLDDVNALASFNFGPGAGVSYQVEKGTFTQTPAGGTSTTAHATVLSVNTFSFSGGGSGCFVIPDTSLTISQSQQSLNLHVTLTSAEQVAQSPIPLEVDLDGAPVPQGAPFGPCFPSFASPPLPMVVDVHWTLNGSVTTRAVTGAFTCGDFSAQYTQRNRFLAAQAVTSLGGGATAPFATMQAEHVAGQVQGPGGMALDCQGPIF